MTWPLVETFFSVLTEAVSHFTEHGFESEHVLQHWMERIRAAAVRDLVPEREMQQRLRDALTAAWDRAVTDGGILRQHPNIPRFTFESIKPRLRDELTRRIAASAQLIRLNRDEAVETTLRRFAGWASSVPPGGTDVASRVEVKQNIRKSLASLPFEARRLAVDQGAKFLANLSDIIATDGGAIAAKWTSRWRAPGYKFRPEHKARDGKVYLIRGSWAQKVGLVKPNVDGYFDDYEKPAELPFCSCRATFWYSLGELPLDLLTQKGKNELARVREVA